MYYGSTKFSQSCRKFSDAIIESEEKVNDLMAMSNEDTLALLCNIYDYEEETYDQTSYIFPKCPPSAGNRGKKNFPKSCKSPVFGSSTATGGFSSASLPSGTKKQQFDDLDSFSTQAHVGFKLSSKSRTAEVGPFQETQQSNVLKSEPLKAIFPNHESFGAKESDDFKEILNGLSLKVDSLCKMFEENKTTMKVLHERSMVNSAKLLSMSQMNNESTKNGEKNKSSKSSVAGASILIKPKRRQSCGKTKKFIKANIDPIRLAIQINNIIRGNYGSIIIECKNEESVKKLERHIELECGSYFDTQILHLCNPRIQVCGISYEIGEDRLIGIIKNQNKLKHEMKLIETFEEINDSSKYNAIVEIDEKLYEKLREDKDPYFNVGWSKCNVYDNIDVKRCSNCWGFNHTSNNCPDKAHIPKRQIPFHE